jgi:hypothetical protein
MKGSAAQRKDARISCWSTDKSGMNNAKTKSTSNEDSDAETFTDSINYIYSGKDLDNLAETATQLLPVTDTFGITPLKNGSVNMLASNVGVTLILTDLHERVESVERVKKIRGSLGN